VKISPQWLREFVELKADNRQLAEDLTRTGTAVESVSGAGDSAIFEMEITTNRVDAMNHYGVARECSAIYDARLKPFQVKLPAAKKGVPFPIEIREPEMCARYTARVVRGIRVEPSPAKIAARLERMDASSINNVVDASNYTLIEIGHPTHAYDLDLLEGGRIIVRRARAGETLKTLDGTERKLHPEDLVIADAKKPVGLAGVMGGFDSMITQKTQNILIEAAWFDPVGIRKTSRRHGMHTDASHRFERGADWGATLAACDRVAQIIVQSSDGESSGGESSAGELVGEAHDVVGRKLRPAVITLRAREWQRILGEEIAEKEARRMLTRLGFEVKRKSKSGGGDGALSVTAPSWRMDVEREIDLIEEIARLYGYDNFRNTLPPFTGAIVDLPNAVKESRTRDTLLALGYHEAVSTSFSSAEEAKEFSSAQAVGIANPVSEDAAVMRTSLAPGMMDMLARNLHHGSSDARLFEMGNVFEMIGSNAQQHQHACLGATGTLPEGMLKRRDYSFFDLKGDVEALLGQFDAGKVYFDDKAGADYYHPGRSARAVMAGATVARLGQAHPEMAGRRKVKQEIYLAEFFLDRLYRHGLRQPTYHALSRYPSVERDFSFIFPEETRFEKIQEAVERLAIPTLRSFAPADMLRGQAAESAGIEAGKYSLLLRATFQSEERTLRDEEVAAWSARIIAALEGRGGRLRS
jgi:phenylalanyl-tRNA synthetase beta chain